MRSKIRIEMLILKSTLLNGLKTAFYTPLILAREAIK